jgi:hypothetical protein
MLRRATWWVLASLLCACSADVDRRPAAGHLGVVAQAIDCPLIVGVSILPLEVIGGGEILLGAELTRDAARVRWSADAGRFTEPEQPTTSYLCERAGEPVLELVIEDASDCAHRVSVRVRCSAAPP